jgi:hypothetical protein
MLRSPDQYVAMLDGAAAGRYAFPAVNAEVALHGPGSAKAERLRPVCRPAAALDENTAMRMPADRSRPRLVPELDQFMEQDIDRMQAELVDGLAAAFAARGRRAERLKALIRLALDFWTWRRLSREGLDDEAAAQVMAAAIAAQSA